MGTLTIEIKQVYGKTLYYPADSYTDTALYLTGKKTFSKIDLEIFKSLGFTIEIATPKI